MTGRIAIIKYMNANIEDHIDPLTGEVNSDTLAEDACWALEPDLVDVPDKYFDFAYYVSERYEIKTGIKKGSLVKLQGFIDSLPSDYF